MKHLIYICFLALSFNSAAQDRIVTGRLLDKATQEPIENANIIVQGATTGSVSNAKGYFQLTLKPNFRSLVISHVSYQTVLVDIPESDKFRIELEKVYILLPEVVLSLRPPELAPFSESEIQMKGNAKVEESASFYGGIEYLNYYLATNYKYPEDLDSLVIGKTYVSFEISVTGATENIEIQDDSLAMPMQKQIDTLFSSMPDWRPASQRGKKVRQSFIIPVIYGLVTRVDPATTYLSYYLNKTISYPEEAVRLAIEGTVFVYFALNSSQDFTRLEILQGIGSGCDMMVYNTVKTIPKAELKSLMKDIGDSVFVLPVDFRLDQTSTREDNLVKLTDAVFLDPLEVLASHHNKQLRQQAGIIIYPTKEFYSVEGAVKHIDNATKLVIVNQQLTSLSPNVGKLINLELIDLENNKLQSLPEELSALQNLKELYAPQNQLSSLPMWVNAMPRLKVVGLAYNSFDEFPLAILGFKKLNTLDLSNNQINLLPPAIGSMKNLRTLILRNNNLNDLPEEFFRLRLKELNLEGNELSDSIKLKIKESFKNAKITL